MTVAGGSAGVKDGAGNAAAADSRDVQHARPVPVLGLQEHRRPARRRPGGLARRGRHEVPLRPGRLRSPACASTSSRATPARTSATSGRAPASSWPSARSATRPASGWQQVDLPDAGRDHRRTRPTSVVLRRRRPLRLQPRLLHRSASTTRRCTRPADGVDGGNGVYQLRRRAPSRPDASARTNYWVDAVFEHEHAADTRPPDRAVSPAAERRHAGRADGQGRRRTFDEAVDSATVNTGRHARRRPPALRSPARSPTTSAAHNGHAHAAGVACLRHHVHGHDQERQRRRDRPRGQQADRGQDVDFRDGVGVPVHDLRPGHREARGAERGAGPAGRARRPVPRRSRTATSRRCASTRAQQHRHARRAPVDGRRARC